MKLDMLCSAASTLGFVAEAHAQAACNRQGRIQDDASHLIAWHVRTHPHDQAAFTIKVLCTMSYIYPG